MPTLSVTVGSGLTQVSPRGIGWRQITFINTGLSATVNVGDSTVSATNGIPLNPGGSYTKSAANVQGGILSDSYLYPLAGGAGSVVVVDYVPA
jgi:hypothetical protein